MDVAYCNCDNGFTYIGRFVSRDNGFLVLEDVVHFRSYASFESGVEGRISRIYKMRDILREPIRKIPIAEKDNYHVLKHIEDPDEHEKCAWADDGSEITPS